MIQLIEDEEILSSKTTCYKIVRLTGEGCFGQVYVALNQMTNKEVAIKVGKMEDADEREVLVFFIIMPSVLPNLFSRRLTVQWTLSRVL